MSRAQRSGADTCLRCFALHRIRDTRGLNLAHMTSRIVAAALLALALTAGSVSAQERSLYQRLGGYDAIAAIVDDFGGRLGADARFQRFFAGASTNSQVRQRQLVVDMICQAAGGPCFYIGRDMKTAHAGLGVSKAEWDASVKLFGETLAKFNVGEREQSELAALIAPLEKDIVEK